MRTLLALALVASTAAAAHAGTYIGVGIGAGANVGDDSGTSYEADGRSARAVLGYRIGPFSIEGMYSGYGVVANHQATAAYDTRNLQLAGKYNFALGDNFEVFGRLGLLRSDLTARDKSTQDLDGNGYTFSVGAEYRLKLIATGLGVYIDWTRNSASLANASGEKVDQTASLWTLGVNFSL